MKLIRPSFEIIEQKPGMEGIYDHIEMAARTCYKSTKPEGSSSKDFVDNLIKNKHYAMLEHGTVYLRIPTDIVYGGNYTNDWGMFCNNPYIPFTIKDHYFHFSSNYRTILENGFRGALEYMCEPTKYHTKRITVKFITSIGIVRELLRHKNFCVA